MAIYPKKSKDPTEVALSAIQDALNVRDPDIAPPIAASRATVAEASSDSRKRAPRMPPIEPLEPEPFDPPAFPPPDDRDLAAAANDDQEAIGQVLQSMQRPPRSTAFLIATLLSVLWVISALGLMFALGGQLRGMFGDIFTAIPAFIGLATAVCAPVVFFYVLANMLKRSQELRAIAQSMAEITLRFAEPDTMARDSIVTVGQAIRGEGAAMGDGVERALARAAELETLVNSEVSALERAYNDNEVRIRNLLDGLAQQRETLVGQAEQVRNAITNVHLDLSHDITSVSELIAERVNEAAQRITRSLAEKGEQITVALGTAGDTMIEQLGERGTDLLERLERTSDDTTRAIETASERLTTGMNFKTDAINDQFTQIASNLQQALAGGLDGVINGFSERTSSLLQSLQDRTGELTDA